MDWSKVHGDIFTHLKALFHFAHFGRTLTTAGAELTVFTTLAVLMVLTRSTCRTSNGLSIALILCIITYGLAALSCSRGMSYKSKDNSPVENAMAREQEFARLFDVALVIVDERVRKHEPSDSLSLHQLKVLRDMLVKQREDILKNEIDPYEGQLFGPMKGVIDWGEADGSELREALYRIEIFYRQHY